MNTRVITSKQSIILVWVLLCFSVSFSACGSGEEKAREAELSRDKAIEFIYRSDAALLAIKYGIEEEKVFNLLVDEDPAFNSAAIKNEEDVDGWMFGTNVAKRIESYSQKYDIPKKIIASILIDYKTMSCGY